MTIGQSDAGAGLRFQRSAQRGSGLGGQRLFGGSAHAWFSGLPVGAGPGLARVPTQGRRVPVPRGTVSQLGAHCGGSGPSRPTLPVWSTSHIARESSPVYGSIP
jgi:hypothetical protein